MDKYRFDNRFILAGLEYMWDIYRETAGGSLLRLRDGGFYGYSIFWEEDLGYRSVNLPYDYNVEEADRYGIPLYEYEIAALDCERR